MRIAGRNDRIELRQPLRQFPIEETAQLDPAGAAFEKDGVGGFGLRQREFVRDGAGAHERVHRLLNGFGNARITIVPQERITDADANPGKIACARARDEPDRIDASGIERGKAVGDIANAARQQAGRVERERKRHHALTRPAPERDLQSDSTGHRRRNPHRAGSIAAEREQRRPLLQADAGAARRTAYGAMRHRVPRIVPRTPMAVMTGATERELDHMGLTRDDAELTPQSGDERPIPLPGVRRQPSA